MRRHFVTRKTAALWPALALTSALLLPAVVRAADATPDAHALGVTESILSYCTRVNPSAAVKIRAKVNRMLQGASAASVIAIRKTPDYRQGFAAVTDFVGKVEKQNASRPCTAALAEPKGAAP